jgi:hypothetical protein
MTNVVRMNQLSSRNFKDVPLPARQQLGYFDETVDKDARSGNGVDQLRQERGNGAGGQTGRDYGYVPPLAGSRVSEVTYHLDSTPPPAEPAGAPGSESYNRSQAREGRNTEPMVDIERRNNSATARQDADQPVTTQRAATGRNERYMAAVAPGEDSESVRASEDGAAKVVPSASAENNNSARKTVQATLSYVGDDKDKAREALEAEKASDNPRSSLVSKLEDIVNDDKNDDNN